LAGEEVNAEAVAKKESWAVGWMEFNCSLTTTVAFRPKNL